MTEIHLLNSHSALLHRLAQARDGQPTRLEATYHRNPDSLEVSEIGSLLQELDQLPEVREDVVAHFRAAIEYEGYLSIDKLEIAMDRLEQDLQD